MEGDLVEASGSEPCPDGGSEVGITTVARPDHLAVRTTELRCRLDGRSDVVVGDVAEDAAEEQQVGRYRIGVDAALGRVGSANLDSGIDSSSSSLGASGQRCVVLDEQGRDAARIGTPSENPEQIASVARTGGDRA